MREPDYSDMRKYIEECHRNVLIKYIQRNSKPLGTVESITIGDENQVFSSRINGKQVVVAKLRTKKL